LFRPDWFRRLPAIIRRNGRPCVGSGKPFGGHFDLFTSYGGGESRSRQLNQGHSGRSSGPLEPSSDRHRVVVGRGAPVPARSLPSRPPAARKSVYI
jgi:hypothetical protein